MSGLSPFIVPRFAQIAVPDELLIGASVALVLVAVGLLVAELTGPTHGTAAAGGAVVLVAALLLRAREGDALYVPLLALFAVGVVVFVGFCAFEIAQLRKRRSVSGAAGLLDALGTVRQPLNPVGSILVAGERWRAVTPNRAPLPAGAPVRVLSIHGLTLVVAPVFPTEASLPPAPAAPYEAAGGGRGNR